MSPGGIVGAQARMMQFEWLEARAEKTYETKYDARFGTAGHYSDAKKFLTKEISLALELEPDYEAERPSERFVHIKAVYRSRIG